MFNTLIQNEDGSYDVYFGPEAPEGDENNWAKNNEGDAGLFSLDSILRLQNTMKKIGNYQ